MSEQRVVVQQMAIPPVGHYICAIILVIVVALAIMKMMPLEAALLISAVAAHRL